MDPVSKEKQSIAAQHCRLRGVQLDSQKLYPAQHQDHSNALSKPRIGYLIICLIFRLTSSKQTMHPAILCCTASCSVRMCSCLSSCYGLFLSTLVVCLSELMRLSTLASRLRENLARPGSAGHNYIRTNLVLKAHMMPHVLCIEKFSLLVH